ncbi:MAG: hypothetical protein H0V44_16860 [Planctomycetes bacterium]|nr:hypothetical protein [Planctomycetota bacterium]
MRRTYGGFVAKLRSLTRPRAREAVEAKLLEAFTGLARIPAVAAIRTSDDSARVVHYTFDEPFIDSASAQVQFTYHLAIGPATRAYREEIRGSGVATIDDAGRVHLDGVDAELYRIVDDVRSEALED